MLRFDYESHSLSLGSQTFANNLSILLNAHGITKTELCATAGISRTQLARFLNGSSYPKPATLVKICDLFCVDARILTNRLMPRMTEKDLSGHYKEIWDLLLEFGAFSEDQSIFKYIPPSKDDVEDGLYRAWFPDAIALGTYYCAIAQVSTKRDVRVLESRELLSDWGDLPKPKNRSPRHRGVCYKQSNGFCTLQFIGNSHMRFFLSFEKLNRLHPDCYGGVALWTSDGGKVPFFVQPVVMEQIPRTLRDAVNSANNAGACAFDEIPGYAQEHFLKVRNAASRFVEIL